MLAAERAIGWQIAIAWLAGTLGELTMAVRPLEELELLDEMEVERLATANDDGTETWLRTLLKILCGELLLRLKIPRFWWLNPSC